MPTKTGAWDDDGYWKAAFFFLWLDDAHPDSLYGMNLSMKAGDGAPWSPASFYDLTGKTVDELWTEYAAVACCQGKTQTCRK